MYIPEHFEERDLAVLQTLVRAHPLGAWVSEVNGVLEVNHLPFILDDRRGEFGTLVGHVARANPVWKVVSSRVESVVVFQGPQGYITPSWYPLSMTTAGSCRPGITRSFMRMERHALWTIAHGCSGTWQS